MDKTELTIVDLQSVLGMDGAVNALAVINWIEERLETLTGSSEAISRIKLLKQIAHDTLSDLGESDKYLGQLGIIWHCCWGENRWREYSHPALKLAVQILANIAQDKRSDFGLADFYEYENTVNDVRQLKRAATMTKKLGKMEGRAVTVFFSDDRTPCAATGVLRHHINKNFFSVGTVEQFVINPWEVTNIDLDNGIIVIH